MFEYAQSLGDVVRNARIERNLTQNQLAELIGADSRTILNIENNKGNPKMEILFPLVRVLNIDPRYIFYPELQRDSVAISQLRLLVENCTEPEAVLLNSVIRAILEAMRGNTKTPIK